jgi:hypothetical protein
MEKAKGAKKTRKPAREGSEDADYIFGQPQRVDFLF